MLSDETTLLQFGYSNEKQFLTYVNRGNVPSSWNKFPTKQSPGTRYKYTAIEINFSSDRNLINRSTYSLLDWLGDLGGLLDALYLFGFVMIHPIARFAVDSKILSSLFRYRGSEDGLLRRTLSARNLSYHRHDLGRQETFNDGTLIDSIRKDFQRYKPIKKISILQWIFQCRKNYKKMMNKAKSSLNKELDLGKFIYRQRLQTTAVLGLLSGRQSFFVDRMS